MALKSRKQKVTFLSACIAVLAYNVISVSAQDDDPGSRLFLTPLIKAGEIEKAREEALVTGFDPVIGYSGYITINETYNSNLFFWFFPSEVFTLSHLIQ